MRDHLTRFRALTTDRWGGAAVVGLAVAAVGVVTIVLALRPPAPGGAAASAAAPATTGLGSTTSLTARPAAPGTASVMPSGPRTSNPPTETQTNPRIPGDPSSTSVRSAAPSSGAPDPQQVAARWLQLACTWTHSGNYQDNLQHARTLMAAGAEIGQNWRINAGDWGDLQSRQVDSRCTRITTRVDVGNPSVDGRTTIVVAMTADQIFSSAGNDFQRIAITETRELHRAGTSWLVGNTAGTA